MVVVVTEGGIRRATRWVDLYIVLSRWKVIKRGWPELITCTRRSVPALIFDSDSWGQWWWHHSSSSTAHWRRWILLNNQLTHASLIINLTLFFLLIPLKRAIDIDISGCVCGLVVRQLMSDCNVFLHLHTRTHLWERSLPLPSISCYSSLLYIYPPSERKEPFFFVSLLLLLFIVCCHHHHHRMKGDEETCTVHVTPLCYRREMWGGGGGLLTSLSSVVSEGGNPAESDLSTTFFLLYFTALHCERPTDTSTWTKGNLLLYFSLCMLVCVQGIGRGRGREALFFYYYFRPPLHHLSSAQLRSIHPSIFNSVLHV